MRKFAVFVRPARWTRARLARGVRTPETEEWVGKVVDQRVAAAVRRMEERAGAVEQRISASGSRADEAHRLAVENARAVEHLLQTDVLLWQAVDDRKD